MNRMHNLRDEENEQRNTVILTFHLEIHGHSLDFGIADIGTVKEGKEEENEKGRDDMDVYFPEESFLSDGIDCLESFEFFDVFGMLNGLFLIDVDLSRVDRDAHVEGASGELAGM